MSKRLGVLVVVLALVSSAAGSASKADEKPSELWLATASSLGQRALSDPAAFDFVRSLTTEIGQRLAGTAAHKRAVAWAEARLKAAGFENVHSEPFTFPAWIRGEEKAEIVAPIPQHLAITALGGSIATDANGIEAEIALFRTYDDLLAAAPGSLAGKIAIVTQRMVRAQDGSGYGAANPIRRSGPSEAAKRGAVAYLLRSLGTDSHRLPHTGALTYKDDAPRIPAASLAVPDAEQLERLAALGPVRIRLVLRPTVEENASSWNVVGELKGNERPDEIVLIGGHLDSWDLGTGATDDGAGTAIAFGAARLIGSLPQRPSRTIRVVLFGAEEMDFSGAAYAQAHQGEIGNIVVAAEADFGAGNVYSVQLPPGAAGSDFGRLLQRVIAPLGANVDSRPALFGGEDIRDLHRAGVPTSSLRQDGLDYFDTHHTADDTLDKIDPKRLEQAVAVWTAFTYLSATSGVDFRSLASTAK
ncbi:Zn-dependent amino-or carboxypeptidase, M28 family [Bradyrhizobium erythrophlei]|uniref:Carboxypeptidase Q n=1 Tax=Bradyrhizobium erythrophlei TaxID=1437360 RepID=A0A1M7TDM4_9BRAD|nr:Zn-dependent amino-or carboxypeptidase, M28 family [Bradyrhizobium erythrophlei]